MSVHRITGVFLAFIFKFDSINSCSSQRHLTTLALDSKLIDWVLDVCFKCVSLRVCVVFVCYLVALILLCFRQEFYEILLSGMNVFLRCCATELVSERCILILLDRVVEVKPTYILLFSEIQSPKKYLNWYITVFWKILIEWGYYN